MKPVAEALVDGDTEFRCKDCHGEVKLHKRLVANGPAPHAAHTVGDPFRLCYLSYGMSA